MTQITFSLAAAATTAGSALAATTSGPIKIPSWAPDIASMATTTISGHAVGFYATTTKMAAIFNPTSYTKRSFNLKTGAHLNEETSRITMHYNGVGELVRT